MLYLVWLRLQQIAQANRAGTAAAAKKSAELRKAKATQNLDMLKSKISANRNVEKIPPLRFTQTTASYRFDKDGAFASQTIGDVANSLRSGKLSPKDVPVNYIEKDGVRLIENTRSSLVLKRANIPESQWNLLNQTGNVDIEIKIQERLIHNKLPPTGTDVLKITGGKTPSASYLR